MIGAMNALNYHLRLLVDEQHNRPI